MFNTVFIRSTDYLMVIYCFDLGGETMELVKKIDEMIENAKRFDAYIERGTPNEKHFAINCIALGRCFVVIKENDKHRFYPSKYIGYKNNSASRYEDAYYDAEAIQGEEKYGEASYYTFDGRVSNKAITKVLGCVCEKDHELTERFIEYCNGIGLKGSDKRKFWKNIIEL